VHLVGDQTRLYYDARSAHHQERNKVPKMVFEITAFFWGSTDYPTGRNNDSLRAGQSGDQIPVEARIFVSVQTGPGAHLASYARGKGAFQGVKRPGHGVDCPPPSSAEVK